MPGPFKRLIPSMFARRLLLLAVAAVAAFAVLAGKLAWITTVEAAARRAEAESVLTSTSLVPTVRGRILDYKDRVLAREKASYDVAVHYSVITGDWAYHRARRDAYNANRYRWREMGPNEQEQVISLYEDRYAQKLADFWDELADLGSTTQTDLADRRATIVQKVQQVASYLWVQWQQREARRIQGDVPLYRVAKSIGEEESKHAVIEDVGPQTRVRIAQMIAESSHDSVWQQVAVVDSRRRVYPHEVMEVTVDRSTLPLSLQNDEPITIRLEGVAMHAIGAMRPAWAKDLEQHPFVITEDGRRRIDLKGYRPGDRMGSFGIEASQEDVLRGSRGKRTIDRITDETIETIDPQRGRDVVLSLDIHLQARIEALMSQDPRVGLMRGQPWHAGEMPPEKIGKPLNGSAVVLDVALGQVRAAVSVPGISRSGMDENAEQFTGDLANLPMWYRPVAMPYEPGSTVKPIVLASAVIDRKVGYDEQVYCHGYFDPNNRNILRCWYYNYFGLHHENLDGPHAVMHSCNIFFFEMGKRLGSRRLVTWYDRFGLGRYVYCGLLGESRGDLPDLAQSHVPNTPGFAPRDAVLMSIGQGPIRWTPLQAARAYATLARNGNVVNPTFLAHGATRTDDVQDWTLDPKGVQMALEGLRLAATEPEGSVHHISMEHEDGSRVREDIFRGLPEDLTIMAKSGTADTEYTRIDDNSDGTIQPEEVRKRGDHAWTICLVQRPTSPRPDFVIVVVAEFAGSGARVSGPIVNQILRVMREEGYL